MSEKEPPGLTANFGDILAQARKKREKGEPAKDEGKKTPAKPKAPDVKQTKERVRPTEPERRPERRGGDNRSRGQERIGPGYFWSRANNLAGNDKIWSDAVNDFDDRRNALLGLLRKDEWPTDEELKAAGIREKILEEFKPDLSDAKRVFNQFRDYLRGELISEELKEGGEPLLVLDIKKKLRDLLGDNVTPPEKLRTEGKTTYLWREEVRPLGRAVLDFEKGFNGLVGYLATDSAVKIMDNGKKVTVANAVMMGKTPELLKDLVASRQTEISQLADKRGKALMKAKEGRDKIAAVLSDQRFWKNGAKIEEALRLSGDAQRRFIEAELTPENLSEFRVAMEDLEWFNSFIADFDSEAQRRATPVESKGRATSVATDVAGRSVPAEAVLPALAEARGASAASVVNGPVKTEVSKQAPAEAKEEVSGFDFEAEILKSKKAIEDFKRGEIDRAALILVLEGLMATTGAELKKQIRWKKANLESGEVDDLLRYVLSGHNRVSDDLLWECLAEGRRRVDSKALVLAVNKKMQEIKKLSAEAGVILASVYDESNNRSVALPPKEANMVPAISEAVPGESIAAPATEALKVIGTPTADETPALVVPAEPAIGGGKAPADTALERAASLTDRVETSIADFDVESLPAFLRPMAQEIKDRADGFAGPKLEAVKALMERLKEIGESGGGIKEAVIAVYRGLTGTLRFDEVFTIALVGVASYAKLKDIFKEAFKKENRIPANSEHEEEQADLIEMDAIIDIELLKKLDDFRNAQDKAGQVKTIKNSLIGIVRTWRKKMAGKSVVQEAESLLKAIEESATRLTVDNVDEELMRLIDFVGDNYPEDDAEVAVPEVVLEQDDIDTDEALTAPTAPGAARAPLAPVAAAVIAAPERATAPEPALESTPVKVEIEPLRAVVEETVFDSPERANFKNDLLRVIGYYIYNNPAAKDIVAGFNDTPRNRYTRLRTFLVSPVDPGTDPGLMGAYLTFFGNDNGRFKRIKNEFVALYSDESDREAALRELEGPDGFLKVDRVEVKLDEDHSESESGRVATVPVRPPSPSPAIAPPASPVVDKKASPGIMDRAREWWGVHVNGEKPRAEWQGSGYEALTTVQKATLLTEGLLSVAGKFGLAHTGSGIAFSLPRYWWQKGRVTDEKGQIRLMALDMVVESKKTEAERDPANTRYMALIGRINGSRYISADQKTEMVFKFTDLEQEIKSGKAIEDAEIYARIKKIIDSGVEQRVTGHEVARDALNAAMVAIRAAGAVKTFGVSEAAYAGARFGSYAAIGLAQRYAEITRRSESDRSVTDKLEAAVRQGFSEWWSQAKGEKGRIGQITAFGRVASLAGVAMSSVSAFERVLPDGGLPVETGQSSGSEAVNDSGITKSLDEVFSGLKSKWSDFWGSDSNTPDVGESDPDYQGYVFKSHEPILPAGVEKVDFATLDSESIVRRGDGLSEILTDIYCDYPQLFGLSSTIDQQEKLVNAKRAVVELLEKSGLGKSTLTAKSIGELAIVPARGADNRLVVVGIEKATGMVLSADEMVKRGYLKR